MIVLDASVALKWFVDEEPLVDAARAVLDDVERDPRRYLIPELFMNELLAVLSRLPRASRTHVQAALDAVESLGLSRVGNGHELLGTAADFACTWHISGYDAVYLALAALSGGVWLTADARAVARVPRRALVRVLGR